MGTPYLMLVIEYDISMFVVNGGYLDAIQHDFNNVNYRFSGLKQFYIGYRVCLTALKI